MDKSIEYFDKFKKEITELIKNKNYDQVLNKLDLFEAPQALKESEAKYRGLVENLKYEYFFYRHNVDGVFEYISPSIKNVLGYSQEEFLTHFNKYLTDNPINKEVNKKTELSIKGIQQLPYELEIFDSHKNINILEVTEIPITGIKGNVIAVEGIAHNITKQKEAEETIYQQLEEIQVQNEEIKSINEEINAVNDNLETRLDDINKLNEELSISKNKYKSLVKNIPGVVFSCRKDKNWTMEYLSDEIEVITGYPASDFINNEVRTFASIIHPEDSNKVNSSIIRDVNESGFYTIEYKLIQSNGKIVWVYESGQRLLMGNSEDIHLNGVIIDITGKKIAEESLIESEKQLRISNAQKDKFFSLLAHDLRSPIGNFLQISELLKSSFNELSSSQINDFFDDLHNIADRTFKLLDNLLMWSRSQLGKLKIETIEINLFQIVNEVADLFEENFKSKNIEFKNEIEQDLVVTVDLNIIQTLFRNLIGNAIKFTNVGGSIIVASKKKIDRLNNNENYVVSVQDTGIGIPKDKIETIFNIDDDYSTPGTENEEGTGLGLILCKELIEKSEEKIWVDSKVGVGTIFYFTLKR